ncbi:hypothetical protein CS542_00350 [Pedobacter sp. IW39]|nr:hypothetical protein CS542_00350 [Pedobacter sp. IW39]
MQDLRLQKNGLKLQLISSAALSFTTVEMMRKVMGLCSHGCSESIKNRRYNARVDSIYLLRGHLFGTMSVDGRS